MEGSTADVLGGTDEECTEVGNTEEDVEDPVGREFEALPAVMFSATLAQKSEYASSVPFSAFSTTSEKLRAPRDPDIMDFLVRAETENKCY